MALSMWGVTWSEYTLDYVGSFILEEGVRGTMNLTQRNAKGKSFLCEYNDRSISRLRTMLRSIIVEHL